MQSGDLGDETIIKRYYPEISRADVRSDRDGQPNEEPSREEENDESLSSK